MVLVPLGTPGGGVYWAGLPPGGLGLPCSTCSMTRRAFLAAHPPMETWSSVAALVERESTDEGWHRALFSETARGRCQVKRAPTRKNGPEDLCFPKVLHGMGDPLQERWLVSWHQMVQSYFGKRSIPSHFFLQKEKGSTAVVSSEIRVEWEP